MTNRDTCRNCGRNPTSGLRIIRGADWVAHLKYPHDRNRRCRHCDDYACDCPVCRVARGERPLLTAVTVEGVLSALMYAALLSMAVLLPLALL